MRVRLPEIETDPAQPFAACGLKREGFGHSLTSLVESIEGGGVLSLEGEWGSGKTTFLNMWAAHLKNEGFTVVKFNAWESDHCSDPLVALLSAFEKQISDESGEAKNWKKAVISVGWDLLKLGVPIAVKAATASFVDVSSAGGTAITEVNEHLGRKLVEDFEVQKSAIQQFQINLQKLAESSSEKLIVLVDELDRCRPTYAIEMLERIKHLFEVPEVVFVLALNCEQLQHSVSAVYGAGFDSRDYMNRFIDLTCRLPAPSRQSFLNVTFAKYGINEEIARKEQLRFHSGSHAQIEDVLCALFDHSGSSLRTIEKVCSHVTAVFAITPVRKELFSIATGVLVFLRHQNFKLYKSFLETEISAPSLIRELKKNPSMVKFLATDAGENAEFWLRAIASSYRCGPNGFSDLEALKTPEDDDSSGARMLRWYKQDAHKLGSDKRNYLYQKLELADAVIGRDQEAV